MADEVTAAVVAQGLIKRYGRHVAVRGIDFSVRMGERFGFLGPNGAGKSSTMKMIYGRTSVSAGRLDVLGIDAVREPLRVKRRLGVVPQDNNLDPDLTAQENLEIFARLYGFSRSEARTRAQESLRRFELDEFARGRPDDFSGGMKRRLVIARALLHEPELVVLDEPTTGLDPRARHLLWQQLEALSAGGVTLIVTTHYMEEAARLFQRLVAMDRGRILAEGSPADIVRETVGAEVVELAAGRWRPQWQTRLGGVLRRALTIGASVYLCGDGGAIVRALAELEAGDAGVRPEEARGAARVRPATLEDAFLALSGREIDETDT